MSAKRNYDHACGVALALNRVGERWGLLVVRDLLLSPKRFTDLRNGLPGISPNVLTQRLEELERSGVVYRRRLPPPASAWVYDLTEWGRELEPVVLALARWGARAPELSLKRHIKTDSFMLGVRAMFAPQAATGFNTDIELRFGPESFHVAVADGRLHLTRGRPQHVDAVIETQPDILAGLMYGGRTLADALSAGDLTIQGDQSVATGFLRLFPLPAGAAIGA